MTEPQNARNPGWRSEAYADHSQNIGELATARCSGRAVAGLKARFAIAGHQVYDGANDDFIVTRWGMYRHCPDLEALGMFARVLGVDHG